MDLSSSDDDEIQEIPNFRVGTREQPIDLDDSSSDLSPVESRYVPYYTGQESPIHTYNPTSVTEQRYYSDSDEERYDSSEEEYINIPLHFRTNLDPDIFDLHLGRDTPLDDTNLSEKEKIIRLYSTKENFKYGLFVASRCKNIILEKNHLKGKCDNIQVNIYFEDIEKFKIRNIVCGVCNETDLWCKHACAILLFFARFPEKVLNIQKIQEFLEKTTKEELAIAYINLSKKNNDFLNFIQVEILKLSSDLNNTNECLNNLSRTEEKIEQIETLPLQIHRKTENYLDPCFFSNKIEKEILRQIQNDGFCRDCGHRIFSSHCTSCQSLQEGPLLREITSSIEIAKNFIVNKNELSGIEILMESLRGLLSMKIGNLYDIIKNPLNLIMDEIQNVFIDFIPNDEFSKEFQENINELMEECTQNQVKEIISTLKNATNLSKWGFEELNKILKGEIVKDFIEPKKVVNSRCMKLLNEKRFQECLNYSKSLKNKFYEFISMIELKQYEEAFIIGNDILNNTIDIDRFLKLITINQMNDDQLKQLIIFYSKIILNKNWDSEMDICILTYLLLPYFKKLKCYNELESIIFKKCDNYIINWCYIFENDSSTEIEKLYLEKHLRIKTIQYYSKAQYLEKTNIDGLFISLKPKVNENFIIKTYKMCGENKKEIIEALNSFENHKMLETLVHHIPELEPLYFGKLLKSSIPDILEKINFTRYIDEKIEVFIKHFNDPTPLNNLFSSFHGYLLLFEPIFKNLKEKGIKGMVHLLKEYSKNFLPFYNISFNENFCTCETCLTLRQFISNDTESETTISLYHKNIEKSFPELEFKPLKGKKRKKEENDDYYVTKKLSSNYPNELIKYFNNLREITKWIYQYDPKSLKEMMNPIVLLEYAKLEIENKNYFQSLLLLGATNYSIHNFYILIRSIQYLTPLLKNIETIQNEINQSKNLINRAFETLESKIKFNQDMEIYLQKPLIENSIIEFFKPFFSATSELKEIYFSFLIRNFGTYKFKELLLTNKYSFYEKSILNLTFSQIKTNIGTENTKLLFTGISRLSGDLSNSVYHLLKYYSIGYIPMKGNFNNIFICSCSNCKKIIDFYYNRSEDIFEFNHETIQHYQYLEKIPNITITVSYNLQQQKYYFIISKKFHIDVFHENFLESKQIINDMTDYYLNHSKNPELLENVMNPIVQIKYIKFMMDKNDKNLLKQLFKLRNHFNELKESIEILKNLLKNELGNMKSSIDELIKKSIENIEINGNLHQYLNEFKDYQIFDCFNLFNINTQNMISKLFIEYGSKINFNDYDYPLILSHYNFDLIESTLKIEDSPMLVYENIKTIFELLKSILSKNERLIRYLLSLFTHYIIPPQKSLIYQVPESMNHLSSFLKDPLKIKIQIQPISIPKEFEKNLIYKNNHLYKIPKDNREISDFISYTLQMVDWMFKITKIPLKDLFSEFKHPFVRVLIVQKMFRFNEQDSEIYYQEIKKDILDLPNDNIEIQNESLEILNEIEKIKVKKAYQELYDNFISNPTLSNYKKLSLYKEKWEVDRLKTLKQLNNTNRSLEICKELLEIFTIENFDHIILSTFIPNLKPIFDFTTASYLLNHQIFIFYKYKVPELTVKTKLNPIILQFISSNNLFSKYNQNLISHVFTYYQGFGFELLFSITNTIPQVLSNHNISQIKEWIQFFKMMYLKKFSQQNLDEFMKKLNKSIELKGLNVLF